MTQPSQPSSNSKDSKNPKASKAKVTPRAERVRPNIYPVSATVDAGAQGPILRWRDGDGVEHAVLWRTESGAPAPKRVVLVDDQTRADQAYHWACEGTGMLWTGDYFQARTLLQALSRRQEKTVVRGETALSGKDVKASEPVYPDQFHLYRKNQAQRARILGMLLLPLSADYVIGLRRAPDVAQACEAAFGKAHSDGLPFWISLRELLGLIGAWEWQRKGVPIEALGQGKDGQPLHIHPRHGVFSPVRGEYLSLLAKAAWPGNRIPTRAFDIGTGTGVLAALLAKRGVASVVATDLNPQAIACATDNIRQLRLGSAVEIRQEDMFPQGRAPLIVCNPPWLPGKPATAMERGIYDPQSRMLKTFLQGLPAHLDEGGQGWLILSDLAEHLKLRSREELLTWIDEAGLTVAGREEIRPVHAKASDSSDPLHSARRQEITSLWRLAVKG